MAVYIWKWGDTSLGAARKWGNGDLWNGADLSVNPYHAESEQLCRRLSLVIHKTGGDEFILHHLEARIARLVPVHLLYTADQEHLFHRLSLVIHRTGTTDFVVNRIQAVIAPFTTRQLGYVGDIDLVTPSERLSVKVHHTGSEFVVSRLQIIMSRKKKQPVG